ncbi:MAG: (2Fe-2S)-binding protein [Rhodospirillales bacterium]|nr:(2Fe-2S)-binding protein [Rhodospirillales bacterium]
MGLRGAGIERGRPLRFFFDGTPIDAFAGESVASALLAAGVRSLRASPRAGAPRATFCWMGICQECTVVADGVRRPACRTEVRDGMIVLTGTVP